MQRLSRRFIFLCYLKKGGSLFEAELDAGRNQVEPSEWDMEEPSDGKAGHGKFASQLLVT